ncbi:MAG: hypothetical protein WBM83_13825 [Flavobacteriaceae bacterium]
MKKLLFIISIVFYGCAFGQRNLVFTELGGNGGLFSFNYERQLTTDFGLSLRAGIGMTAFDFKKEEPFEPVPGCIGCGVFSGLPDFVMSLPISVQYLFDLNRNNYLETGLGYTWQAPAGGYDDKSIQVFHASLGFRRYFGTGKKWMWKIMLSPIIGVAGENVYRDQGPDLWGGISIGKRF